MKTIGAPSILDGPRHSSSPPVWGSWLSLMLHLQTYGLLVSSEVKSQEPDAHGYRIYSQGIDMNAYVLFIGQPDIPYHSSSDLPVSAS